MNDSDSEQLRQLVAESFVRYGLEGYGFEPRRAALATALGYRVDAWEAYAELGWLGLRLPEALGGLDAEAATIGALMETVGRHLLLEPILAHAVLGVGALLHSEPSLLEQLAPGIIDGTSRFAMASDGEVVVRDGLLYGTMIGVLHGDVAGFLVVTVEGSGAGLYLVDLAQASVARKNYRLIDGRGAAVFSFDGAIARVIGSADNAQTLLDEAAVALCAEALGSVDYLVQSTAAYLKVRKQFGRTLGSYQALQHRMSELVLLRDEIRALVRAAEQVLSLPEEDRARLVSGTAAYIITAARQVGNEAVQLHGGIGVTDELDISHHFRRLMVITAQLGGRDVQIERFASACRAAHLAEGGMA